MLNDVLYYFILQSIFLFQLPTRECMQFPLTIIGRPGKVRLVLHSSMAARWWCGGRSSAKVGQAVVIRVLVEAAFV